MPRTKKAGEAKEAPVVIPFTPNPYNIEASYTSISGEPVKFRARKFAPLSEISLSCENLASAIVLQEGYSPYLEEFLVWTTLVRLYTDLEATGLLDQDPDLWYEELICSDIKGVLLDIIMPEQYKLIAESTQKLVEYRTRKSSLDILIDILMKDDQFAELLDKISDTQKFIVEGTDAHEQLS